MWYRLNRLDEPVFIAVFAYWVWHSSYIGELWRSYKQLKHSLTKYPTFCSIGFCILVGAGYEKILLWFQDSTSTPNKKAKKIAHNDSGHLFVSGRYNNNNLPAKPQSNIESNKSKKINIQLGPNKRHPSEKVGVLVMALTLTILAFACKTYVRSSEWNTRKTLFSSGVRTNPENAKVQYNYANVLRYAPT